MNNNTKELAGFVEKFRNATPYINAFRNKTFVIYFSGDILINNQFPSLIHDLSLLHSLGIKLVLVHGSRSQIDQKLASSNIHSRYEMDLRISDEDVLAIAKEVSGSIRFDLEALFSSFFKYHPNINNIDSNASKHHQLNIISGNFVTAQPLGIYNGIDFQHTGIIRYIHSDKINVALEHNNIILLSPLGSSPSGEIFNLNSEDLATECAIALSADKLIYLTKIEGIFDKQHQLRKEMTVRDVQNLIDNDENCPQNQHYHRLIKACKGGVKKVQLISQDIDGALLLELFTNQGHGTLITSDILEEITQASIDDVSGILDLIEPLEQKGTIVKRSRETLETEINNFFVVKREQKIIACAALYHSNQEHQSQQKFAELACLAVVPEYQGNSRGNKLFEWICQYAKKSGVEKIYTLTTQTAHWFVERGFIKANINDLPFNKQKSYNYRRNSAVYIKTL
ncbi:MAG: amino-acid N-acetyltransferase [Pseudomonadota bacterium]